MEPSDFKLGFRAESRDRTFACGRFGGSGRSGPHSRLIAATPSWWPGRHPDTKRTRPRIREPSGKAVLQPKP